MEDFFCAGCGSHNQHSCDCDYIAMLGRPVPKTVACTVCGQQTAYEEAQKSTVDMCRECREWFDSRTTKE